MAWVQAPPLLVVLAPSHSSLAPSHSSLVLSRSWLVTSRSWLVPSRSSLVPSRWLVWLVRLALELPWVSHRYRNTCCKTLTGFRLRWLFGRIRFHSFGSRDLKGQSWRCYSTQSLDKQSTWVQFHQKLWKCRIMYTHTFRQAQFSDLTLASWKGAVCPYLCTDQTHCTLKPNHCLYWLIFKPKLKFYHYYRRLFCY